MDAPEPVIYDTAEGKGMRFECLTQVMSEGRQVVWGRWQIAGPGASEVTIPSVCRHGLPNFDQPPDRTVEEISHICAARLESAAKKRGDTLLRAHLEDHRTVSQSRSQLR